MEIAAIQTCKFREHSGGAMVGGFSINDILTVNQFGQNNDVRQLEGFSVPVGLYMSNEVSPMTGGSGDTKAKIILGGTIETGHFEKLYASVASHVGKKSESTRKRKQTK